MSCVDEKDADAGRGPARRGGALRRTSVSPQGKPWRRRNLLPSSISNSHGYHKNNHTIWCGYFYGGDYWTRTSDLLRVNAGFSIFLTFFGYLELFMLRANYFPALLERGFSGCSSRVCGWLCGLRDEAEQIGGRNHPSPKEDSNTLLTKIPAVRYSTFLRSARQPTHFSRFLNLLPGVFCPLQNLHRLF